MNKINLKNGGFVYIEPKNDVEEDDRCKIYDEYMGYIDYISRDVVDFDKDYAEEIKYWENLESPLDYFTTYFRSVTWGTTIEDLIEEFAQENVLYYTPEELEQEIQELREELATKGEQSFCANHLINKIGGYYIYYED